MPFFDYKCDSCGCEVDNKLVKSADQEVKCPKCKSLMRRLISGSRGFILRGEGFEKMHGKELIRAMEKNYGLEKTV